MAKINRDYVLKTFLDKVREAKRQDMKDLKVPVRFLDDLAYIIMQLMSEELSRAYEAIENKPKNDVKPQSPINRKVLKEITPKKIDTIIPLEEKPVEIVNVVVPNGLNEKSEPTTYTAEVPLPKIEEVIKEVEEPKKEEIIENNIEEDDEDEDDDNTNVMYGGTW